MQNRSFVRCLPMLFVVVGIGCGNETAPPPPPPDLCADLDCGASGVCEVLDREATCVCDATHEFDGETCVTKQTYNIVYKDWSDGAAIFLGDTVTGERRELLGLDNGLGEMVEVNPAGTRIAFTTFENDAWQLYVMLLADESLTHLATLDGGPVTGQPAWSPDGETIAFLSFNGAPFTWDVFTVDLDGNQALITSIVVASGKLVSCARPEWSPSGDTLLFSAWRETDFQGFLYSLDVASGELTNIYGSDDTGSVCRAAWSHDGTQVAFQNWSDVYGGWELTTINADGSNPETRLQLLAGLGVTKNRWSPDDATIAFVDFDYEANNGAGEGVLYTLELADDSVARIASLHTGVSAGHVQWSLDGDSLLYTIFDYDFGAARLMTAPRGGGEPTAGILLNSGIKWGYPSWLPERILVAE